jgi:hypothetical protein
MCCRLDKAEFIFQGIFFLNWIAYDGDTSDHSFTLFTQWVAVCQEMGQGLGSAKQAATETAVDNPSTPSLPNGCCHSTSETGPPKLKPGQSLEFILHGIDYLPEFEKRRERRRRKLAVPRFLRIDTALWSRSYLRFLGRVGRFSPERDSSERSESGEPGVTSQELNTKDVVSFDDEFSLSDPVATPDCPAEIVSDEWMSCNSYPFENLVMSGGGSKGYAYIGALKVTFGFQFLGSVICFSADFIAITALL